MTRPVSFIKPIVVLALVLFLAEFYGPAYGVEIAYRIDSLGRRIEKRADANRIKAWLWIDALRPTAELDSNNVVISRFVYAGRFNVPACVIKGTNTFCLITDQLGSVRLVINTQSGEIAQRLDYDEFGEVTLDTNPGFQPLGYAGGFYDPDIGLVRFGARDYNADTGRWTSKDPTRFRGGDANLYSYVAADPVNETDPQGTRKGVITIDSRPPLPPAIQDILDDLEEAIEIERGRAELENERAFRLGSHAWVLNRKIVAQCPRYLQLPDDGMRDYPYKYLEFLEKNGFADPALMSQLRDINDAIEAKRELTREARQREAFLSFVRSVVEATGRLAP